MRGSTIFILTVLLLTSGFVNCSEASVPTERNEAIVFYKAAHPIGKEIRSNSDDWNSCYPTASSPVVLINCAEECEARLRAIQDDLSPLYAPPPLIQLKSDLALAISTGIEAFVSGQRCLDPYESNYSYYCDKADSMIMEMNRLIELVADEWDDGIAHFGLEPSEILP